MTSTDLALLTLAVTCAVFLPMILVVALGIRRRVTETAAIKTALMDTELDAIAIRLRAGQPDTTSAAIDTITEQVSEIRKNFDWLVSDRMIDQAIDMAREGLATPVITAQTGISGVELDAIKKCRKH